jgi:hypothetical protein
MKANESPDPRWRAGSRANSKTERAQNRPSPTNLEADAAAVWFAARIPVPSAPARILAALAGLARAFQ